METMPFRHFHSVRLSQIMPPHRYGDVRSWHRAKHPMLGDLTKEEWNKVHLKHASLHMSFLVPQS